MHICSREKKKLQKTNVLSAQRIKRRAKLSNIKADIFCVCDAVRHTRRCEYIGVYINLNVCQCFAEC